MRQRTQDSGLRLDPDHTYMALDGGLCFNPMDTAKGADIETTIRAMSHNKIRKNGSRALITDTDTKQFYNLYVEITTNSDVPVTIYLTRMSFYNTTHMNLEDLLMLIMDIPVDTLPKHMDRFKESIMLMAVIKARLQGIL